MSEYRKIWCVPDVHGRADLFNKGVELMKANGLDMAQDAIVVLGDMIDRGPDSKGVIDAVIALQEAYPGRVISLRGNHEDFAVDYYVKKFSHSKDAWYMNGGLQTEWSYPNAVMSEGHIRYVAALPYSFEADGFFFSHAPVPRQKGRPVRTAPTQYSVNELTWTYMGPESEKQGGLFEQHEGPISQNGLGIDHLIGVCGHIHRGPKVTEVRIFDKYRMLDCGSGCWIEAPLAIHECKENRTFYVK